MRPTGTSVHLEHGGQRQGADAGQTCLDQSCQASTGSTRMKTCCIREYVAVDHQHHSWMSRGATCDHALVKQHATYILSARIALRLQEPVRCGFLAVFSDLTSFQVSGLVSAFRVRRSMSGLSREAKVNWCGDGCLSSSFEL